MRSRMFEKAALAVFLIVPSCLFMASTNGAILMGTGPVQVNGELAASSSTVFPGDRVQTASNASAFVKSQSALISIAGDSLVKFEGPSVTVEHGAVSLTIAKRMDTHFGNLVVSAGPGAKFQMLNANGIERIAALDGSLTLTDGLRSVTLEAGEMMTHDSRHDPDAPPLNIHTGLPGWVIEVMIEGGIAAGVIGGLAATGAFSGTPVPTPTPPVSPSGP